MLAAARRFARALATVPCDRTRVIGVVAHVDAGKTTLSEEMLALSGAISRSGRVDSGSTATDFLAQERARGITISSAAAHLDWRGTRVVLVDTPGHVDFGHDVDRALRVMDGVVLVVDAVAGAQARTEAVARAALETFGLPCVAVVNKMDRPGADFGKALASVAARCLPEGCAVVPVQRPVFDGAGAFAGPEGALDAAAVADVDDAVADAYLADEAPGDAAVAAGLRRATLAGRAVPAVCAAALRGVGVAEVLDAVVDYLPSPREALAGDGAATGDGFAGFVFKVAHDARRGPLAYARAYRGSARPKEVLASSTGAVERPGQFLTPLGGGLEPAESWDAGDIVVLTGLRSARAGDTLVGPKGSPGFDAARRGAGLRLEDVDVPPPVFAVAAEPGSPSAAKALEAAAAILARDDPSLVVDVDGDTGQVVLRGLGELHLEVALERLRSDFGVDVTFGPPAVALREAPTAETRRPPFVYDRTLGESRLFCALELSLAPRAADVDGEAVYGGGPPRISLAPAARDALDGASKLHGDAALAGLAAAATRGSLGGHALASCDITVEGAALDGDSSLGAVRAACAAALRDALDHAAPAVLEPVMRVDVAVPEARLGAVLDDLAAGRRARVVDVATAGGRATVVARAPLSELLGYATALRSATAGEATFALEYAHHAPR